MKNRSNNKYEELSFMSQWCEALIEFMETPALGQEDPLSDISKKMLIDVLKDIVAKGDLRGMHVMYHETNEDALKFITPYGKQIINPILRERFGQDLNTVNKMRINQIKKILERGYVKSDGEARMLNEWIDTIICLEGKENEIDRINTLLSAYDQKKEKKFARQRSKSRQKEKDN